MATLDTRLKNGDLVEIILDKTRKGPNHDWLKFAKTHKAKAKIRQFAKVSPLESLKKFIPGMR
jgi:GTP pyrophosphokinase